MKRMKYIAAFTLLFSTLPLGAEEFLDHGKLVEQAAAATVEKYPDSDDVLIDDFVRVEYRPDGSSVRWDDTAIKVLTEKGKRDNRSLTLHFNVSYGTNRFTRVQVIKPDGSVQEVDIATQSSVMVDPSQMSSNIYNPNAKVLKLSVPGLEVGDILRYQSHAVRTKTIVPDTWSDYQVFEYTTPMERYTYQVIAPQELPLRKILLKSEIPGTVHFEQSPDEENGKIVYTWTVRDVPRMFDEPNMPKHYTVVQRLLISTLETWEELSSWYWDLCLPRLEATTPEMEAKAHELVAGCSNTLDKIEAVFNFVSQDIRYMGITPEEEAPGYEPHDVSMTFENRYGVCRDKAALLAAMLRIVDIEAFPVIIMAGPKKDEEVPQPFFNHAVTAAVGDNGEYILMDSTDENTKDIFPSYLQNMSYLVARPEGETLLTSPVIPAASNLLHITTNGSLDDNGRLSARSTLVFEGINDTAYRGHFSKIKPEERRRFFEGHLKRSMPTAELKSFEILPAELRDTSEPLTIHLSYTADNLLIEGGEARMLNLPRLGGSLGFANFLIGQTGLEERRYPLYTRMTAGIRETLNLEIPEDRRTIHLPEFAEIETDQVTWKSDVELNGKTLAATNLFLLHTVEFSPDEYRVLKDNLREIEYNRRKKIIFTEEETEEQDGYDVRILNSETGIHLTDAGTWTGRQYNRTEILTYAGTKKFAEIKLPYNPAWREVELVRATVTQPDGTVKEISEEEINLMDAPWVASAPRYPAEKILVANLPGVEVGSVIEYEAASTIGGKPFYSAAGAFTGHDPIDRKTLTVTAPASLPLTYLNTGLAETITTNADDTITYEWTAENRPAAPKEENLPALWAFNSAIFFSTGDWASYGDAVLDHLETAADDQDEAVALARELTFGLDGTKERAVALRNWVAENIRPAGPSLTQLPLSAITPADRTLTDGYGNNTDRMVLLYTMLRAAGMDAEFMLSGNLSLIDEEIDPLFTVPYRKAFDTVLVRTKVDGEAVYLYGESQYAELGTSPYHHRHALLLSSGEIERIDIPPTKANQSRSLHEISLSSDGNIGITESAQLQGTAFEGFHRMYSEITPEERRRHYLELVAKVSQSARAVSELKTDYTAYPGTLEFSVFAERYAVVDGEYLYFTIPGGLGRSLLNYRSSERTLPLKWSSYVDRVTEYNIILPEDYEPVIMPDSYAWQAPDGAGMVSVGVEYSPLAHAIRIVQAADLKPALISADDFGEVVEAGRRLAHPDMRTILLRKKD